MEEEETNEQTVSGVWLAVVMLIAALLILGYQVWRMDESLTKVKTETFEKESAERLVAAKENGFDNSYSFYRGATNAPNEGWMKMSYERGFDDAKYYVEKEEEMRNEQD